VRQAHTSRGGISRRTMLHALAAALGGVAGAGEERFVATAVQHGPGVVAHAPVDAQIGADTRERLDRPHRVQGDGGVSGKDIESALARSGIATDLVAPKELPSLSGMADLGTGLATLRRALKDWLDTEPLARPAPGLPLARPAEPGRLSRLRLR